MADDHGIFSHLRAPLTSAPLKANLLRSEIRFPKISTLAKRDSLVLIFWGISTGDVIYST